MAISGDITKDDTESGPTQEVPSISFTSGTSPRKNGKSKKVRHIYHLAYNDVLTRYYISRFRKTLNSTSAGTICIKNVRKTHAHAITIPTW